MYMQGDEYFMKNSEWRATRSRLDLSVCFNKMEDYVWYSRQNGINMETVPDIFGYVKRQSFHVVNIWDIFLVSSVFCLFYYPYRLFYFFLLNHFINVNWARAKGRMDHSSTWMKFQTCVTFSKVSTGSGSPPWVFFTFLKLYRWYQIAQCIKNILYPHM